MKAANLWGLKKLVTDLIRGQDVDEYKKEDNKNEDRQGFDQFTSRPLFRVLQTIKFFRIYSQNLIKFFGLPLFVSSADNIVSLDFLVIWKFCSCKKIQFLNLIEKWILNDSEQNMKHRLKTNTIHAW